MKLSANLFLLLFFSVVAQAIEFLPVPDSKVLSACAGAIIKEASEHSGVRDPKVVYVLPEWEVSSSGIDRAQLSREFKDVEWDSVAPALNNLHITLQMARFWERRRPPPDIYIPGVRVRIKQPRVDDFGAKDFYFSFWPPGYGSVYAPVPDQPLPDQVALVLAVFGPTPHGAKAACHLRKESDDWVVKKTWVVSWL